MSDAKASSPLKESPLSLERLRTAFSQMLANPATANKVSDGTLATTSATAVTPVETTANSAFDVQPRTIIEAMLFVGRPDNPLYSAREMAAAMRGVSPKEVDAAIAELNECYRAAESPYEIVGSPAGYQLVLCEELIRVKNKFFGHLQEARLSKAAMEVLAIVAYEQPVPASRVNELRGATSTGVLAMLVRRGLVRLERPADSPPTPVYHTTARFLRVFRLASLNDLPHRRDLDEAS